MASNFPDIVPFDLPNVPILSASAFNYATDIVDIEAGAVFSTAIQIQADSDFWLMKTAALFKAVGTKNYVDMYSPEGVPVTMTMTDTGSGQELQKVNATQQGILVGAITGNGKEPYIWPFPRRLRATSMVQMSFKNVGTEKVTGFQFVLQGAKIYYPSSAYGTRGGV